VFVPSEQRLQHAAVTWACCKQQWLGLGEERRQWRRGGPTASNMSSVAAPLARGERHP